jgi:hypothetical protein
LLLKLVQEKKLLEAEQDKILLEAKQEFFFLEAEERKKKFLEAEQELLRLMAEKEKKIWQVEQELLFLKAEKESTFFFSKLEEERKLLEAEQDKILLEAKQEFSFLEKQAKLFQGIEFSKIGTDSIINKFTFNHKDQHELEMFSNSFSFDTLDSLEKTKVVAILSEHRRFIDKQHTEIFGELFKIYDSKLNELNVILNSIYEQKGMPSQQYNLSILKTSVNEALVDIKKHKEELAYFQTESKALDYIQNDFEYNAGVLLKAQFTVDEGIENEKQIAMANLLNAQNKYIELAEQLKNYFFDNNSLNYGLPKYYLVDNNFHDNIVSICGKKLLDFFGTYNPSLVYGFSSLGFGLAFQLCKSLVSNDISFKDIFLDVVQKQEKYILKNVYKSSSSFNVLRSLRNKHSYNFFKNTGQYDEICYSIALLNVFNKFIQEELQLCTSQPEILLKKYSEFNITINDIRVQLITASVIYSVKKFILQESLMNSLNHSFKKRFLITLFFMFLCKIFKVFLLYIWNKIK